MLVSNLLTDIVSWITTLLSLEVISYLLSFYVVLMVIICIKRMISIKF